MVATTEPAPAPPSAPALALCERPFVAGAVAVVAAEEGGLRTWRLGPCRDGRAVCGWGPDGPAVRLRTTPEWDVVTGLDGRAFWLGAGGRGFVERNGRFLPLAWNARPSGTGDGTAAAMESAARHGIVRPGPDAPSRATPSGPPSPRDAWGVGSVGLAAIGAATPPPMAAWPADAGPAGSAILPWPAPAAAGAAAVPGAAASW